MGFSIIWRWQHQQIQRWQSLKRFFIHRSHGCHRTVGEPQIWSGDRWRGIYDKKLFWDYYCSGRSEERQADLRLVSLNNSRRLWGLGAILIVWYWYLTLEWSGLEYESLQKNAVKGMGCGLLVCIWKTCSQRWVVHYLWE